MPIEIAVGLALAKNALDIVRAVREAIKEKKKFTEDEMRDYLETLQDKLVDVKTSLADADDQMRALKRQVEELKRMSDFGAEFKLENGVYFREGVPYCPVCWDVEKKPVRLSGPLPALIAPAGKLMCMCTLYNGQFPLP